MPPGIEWRTSMNGLNSFHGLNLWAVIKRLSGLFPLGRVDYYDTNSALVFFLIKNKFL